MADVLVVGKLGYHEATIVEPILEALNKAGHSITRAGGSLDFFDPQTDQVQAVLTAAPRGLDAYDAVFFVDWWNFVVPLVLYRCQSGECRG